MPSHKQIEEALKQIQAHQELLGSEVTQTIRSVLKRHYNSTLPVSSLQAKRKQITTLYAKISGFEKLTQTMDAEDIIGVMNKLWQNLDAEIIKNGGYIDKHFGDAVIVLWGVELAREDDAERAVRAGLSLKKAMHQFLLDNPNIPFELRIGIHSGQVILGYLGNTGEFTAIGDTVNTASQIGQAASANNLLISQDSYQLIRSKFTCQEQKRLWQESRTQELRTYTVSQPLKTESCDSSNGVDGLKTRTIGREKDLTLAQSACYQAITRHHPGLISISGEAGIGKSRIMVDLGEWLSQQPKAMAIFKGRASQQMQYRPFALLREILIKHWGIPKSQLSATEITKIITDKITPKFTGLTNEQINSICQLLGLIPITASNKKNTQNQALAALVQYLQKTSRTAVPAWLIEDIHWADVSTLTFLAQMYQQLGEFPFLLIVTTRPEFLQKNPQWATWAVYHTHLKLTALPVEYTHKLVKEVLQKVDEIPEQLETLLVEHAHGNPLYMEELVQMLISDGTIISSPNKWLVNPSKLSKVRLPPTLTGILQARLESLPVAERTLLQQASVIGRTFWPQALTYLREQIDASMEDINPLLASLSKKELIYETDDRLLKKRAFAFTNSILREVTHESLLVNDRRQYHDHIAQWLIDQQDESTELFNQIAEHLEQALNKSQAIVYLRHAGEKAQQTFGFHETLHFFKRALALLAQTDNYEDRVQLTREIGRAMINFGQLDSAKTWLQDSLELAKQTATPQQIMTSLQELTQLAKQRGEYQDAMARIEEGLEIIKQHRNLINTDSSAYFQNAKANLSSLLSSATEKASELARQQTEQAKKKLGQAFSGVMSQFTKNKSTYTEYNDSSEDDDKQ